MYELYRSEDVKPPPPLDLTSVDFGDLIGRIRHHVLTNRIRVGNDELYNTGCIGI